MIIILKYDSIRSIMTDGKRWYMFYNTDEKSVDNFEKDYQQMKYFSKKNWAPDECRDCGDRIEKKGNLLHFWRHSPDQFRYTIKLTRKQKKN